ncbi:MAG: DUF2029 domain-containing protein [Candidatus Eremiobacteraeota bacterium]|nr:DUF2029 domain-containing protein [Candidatus Eremiobacteraeota bacterium]
MPLLLPAERTVEPGRRMTRDKAQKIVLGALVVALGALALRDFLRLGDALPWRTMDEFADFYCAGRALDAGANPYAYEPLHRCEHQVNGGTGFRARVFHDDAVVAVPAPLPAYDLLPFAALARLPVTAARRLVLLGIVLAVAICIALLRALGIPALLATAALLLAAAYASVNTAQIIPFALAAVIGCGCALASKRDAIAGVLAALSGIEPVVGVPTALACVCFVPRARLSLIVTGALLVASAVIAVGPTTSYQYLALVLPAQSSAEANFPYQYGMTYLLTHLGLHSEAARLGGNCSYLVLVALGLIAGRRAATATGRRELLAFLPALSSVVAGPYVHAEEVCLAIPAALVLAWSNVGPLRVLLAAASCTLAVPWLLVWGEKQLLLASVLACAAIVWSLRIRLLPAALTVLSLGALMYFFEVQPPHLPTPRLAGRHSYSPDDIVQVEWRDYAAARSTADPLWFAVKIPAWASLWAVLIVGLSIRRRPNGATGPVAGKTVSSTWPESPQTLSPDA